MARLVVQKTEPSANRTDLAAEVRGQLNRAIAWDPLNWDLRLDRVVLDLDFSTNSTRTIAEVGELIRLNPLQSQIPIYLARHVAPRNPELAIEFLRALDLSDPRVLHDALSIAWQAEDPEGDRLSYSLYFRGEDEGAWKLLRVC